MPVGRGASPRARPTGTSVMTRRSILLLEQDKLRLVAAGLPTEHRGPRLRRRAGRHHHGFVKVPKHVATP
jgi:hypothetical protein